MRRLSPVLIALVLLLGSAIQLCAAERETFRGTAARSGNGLLRPVVDLGLGQTYHGQEGGLYPGGSNVRPAAHDAAGRRIVTETKRVS